MQIINNRLSIEATDGRLTIRRNDTGLSIFNAAQVLIATCAMVEAVIANPQSHIEIIGELVGIADKDSVMWASAGARVWALGGRIYAGAGSTVLAEEGSEVHALDGSSVIGKPRAHIIAYYGCVAQVSWQTAVTAYLHSNVVVTDLATMPRGEVQNYSVKHNPDHTLVEGSLLI